MLVELNETDLLARMKNFEDHLVERKVVSDEKDWKKTVVAFANSVPIGVPAVLFIGVRNNGEIETPQRNLDEVAKRFNSKMATVYPRIFYVPKIVSQNGLQALAVIIPGSDLRPHFAGLSYVRRGSESFEASDAQFEELVAQRNSKAATILKWKGKNVTVFVRSGDYEVPWPHSTVVTNCNQFYVSVQAVPQEPPISFSLSRVEINFDNMRNQLQLEITDISRNAWDVEQERHVRQVLGHMMTREGQMLVRHLLTLGKWECIHRLVPEIPMDVQQTQMQTAMSQGIVLQEQEPEGRHRTFYIVNSEYRLVLQRVLPGLLKS
jgi:hypothetical protein